MKSPLSRSIALLCPGILLAFPLLVGARSPQLVEAQIYTLMSAGIEAYDAGDFEAAIEKYSGALDLDPGNTLILYERSLAYLSTGEYELCIQDVELGLGRGSANEAGLFAMLGNCRSEQGNGDQALEAFTDGLELFPEHLSLNFNIAVALARDGEQTRALTHLKTALAVEPNYPSANLLLGQLYEAQGYRLPAIYQYLRFLTTELLTPRTAGTAQALLDLVRAGVERDDEEGDTINPVVSPNESQDEEGDFSSLEFMLTLMSSASLIEDDAAASRSPAENAVATVASAIEVATRSDDEALHDTWVWRHAVPFLVALDEAGHLETMSYLAFSELEGSRQWIDENSGSVERFLAWRQENALPRG